MGSSSWPLGAERRSPSWEQINRSSVGSLADHTGQLIKAGAHMAPHPHCWVLAPTQKQPHRWPGHAPGAPGATQRSGWAQPWASKPPISEGNLQRSSPFLCALFFVLLKFSPPCRWPPPPAQPRKGAEAWGVRNPDPAKKLHRGDQPGEGPLIVYAGWTGRFLWSRWPQERGAQTPGQRTGTVDAAEGRGGRSDCKE